MSEGKREADVEFPLSSVGKGGGCWGGGYGYFLALHNVILFKNKVNRKQPKTDKPQGDSPMKGAAGMLVGSFKLNPQGDQSWCGPMFF